MIEEMKLKPCPFCGYKVTLRDIVSFGHTSMGYVSCGHCGTISGFGQNVYDAINAWNRRVPS